MEPFTSTGSEPLQATGRLNTDPLPADVWNTRPWPTSITE